MLLDTIDTTLSDSVSESTCSERRLAANRANAQLSTGPRTDEGKTISSLNAVKTGLCGRAVLLADAEEAAAYRAHVERIYSYWRPANTAEHGLVQSLADTQWRLESIPGLESALYAQARLRATPLLQHPDPATARLLLTAQVEVAEEKAIKNLRLHERRLRNQMAKDKEELERLIRLREAYEGQARREERKRQQEEAERAAAEAARAQEEAARQRRRERAQRRAERRHSCEAATAQNLDGFEFSTSPDTAVNEKIHPVPTPAEVPVS